MPDGTHSRVRRPRESNDTAKEVQPKRIGLMGQGLDALVGCAGHSASRAIRAGLLLLLVYRSCLPYGGSWPTELQIETWREGWTDFGDCDGKAQSRRSVARLIELG